MQPLTITELIWGIIALTIILAVVVYYIKPKDKRKPIKADNKPYFKIRRSRDKSRFYFTFHSPSHQCLITSETYDSVKSTRKAIEVVRNYILKTEDVKVYDYSFSN